MSGILILGWGSLLWEAAPEFDRWHGPWHAEGPPLKLEFSRVSSSRDGILTLVIDPERGAVNSVAYTASRRALLPDAVADLRSREKTTAENIGRIGPAEGDHHYRDPASADAITAWAGANGAKAVVWTDLASNFGQKIGEDFSVTSAMNYLKDLDAPVRAKAIDYISRVPPFIETPLRTALATQKWFAEYAKAGLQPR